jgi:hypothetical protein
MDAAAAYGNLTLVQWLHDNRNEGCTELAIDEAAMIGATAVLQFLRRHRGEGCSPASFRWAIRTGRDGSL